MILVKHTLVFAAVTQLLACDAGFDGRSFERAHTCVIDQIQPTSVYERVLIVDYRHTVTSWVKSHTAKILWDEFAVKHGAINDTVLLIETANAGLADYMVRAVFETDMGGCLVWGRSDPSSGVQFLMIRDIDSSALMRIKNRLDSLFALTGMVDDLTIVGEDGTRDFVTVRKSVDSLTTVAVAHLIMAPLHPAHRYAALQEYVDTVFGRRYRDFERTLH